MSAEPPLRIRRVRLVTSGFDSDRVMRAGFLPDGGSLVFNGRRPGDRRDALYRIRVDGTGLERLFQSDGPVSDPSCAPDGSAVVFNSGSAVCEYDLVDNRIGLVAEDALSDQGAPTYTRDGLRVLYCTSYGLRLSDRSPVGAGSAASGTLHQDVKSPGTRNHVPDYGGLVRNPNDREPAPAPDGCALAVRSRDSTGAVGLFLVRTDTAVPMRSRIADGDAGRPTWSPDGRFLAYEGRANQARNWTVRAWDRAGRSDVELKPGPGASWRAPVFSPDGRSIAVTRVGIRGQELHVLELESIPGRAISDTPGTTLGEVEPGAAADSVEPQLRRAEFKIVVFAEDQGDARALLKRLQEAGYDNPESYACDTPLPRAAIKHNGVPEELLQELTNETRQLLNVRLVPETEPRLPRTTIYINVAVSR